MITTVGLWLVCLSATIVFVMCMLLVWHPKYKSRIFGTIAYGFLAVASFTRVAEVLDLLWNGQAVEVSKVALINWIGLAILLSWIFARFMWRWKRKGQSTWIEEARP